MTLHSYPDVITQAADVIAPELGAVAVLAMTTSSLAFHLVGEPKTMIAPTGYGTTPPTITITGAPVSASGSSAARSYSVYVDIVDASDPAAVEYRVSLDTGASWTMTGGTFNSAAGAAVTITDALGVSTGLTLTFPIGTYANDQYWEDCTPYLAELDGTNGAIYDMVCLTTDIYWATDDVATGTIASTATRTSNPTRRCGVVPMGVIKSFRMPTSHEYLYLIGAASGTVRVWPSSRPAP